MKRMKNTLTVLLVLVMVLAMSLTSYAADAVTFADVGATKSDIVVFYTSDVHGGVSDRSMLHGTSETCLGYAGVAAIKAEAEAAAGAVTLVDLGDSIQGSAIDTDTNGENSLKLMKELGYEVCVPGNHEFDFGLDSFLTLSAASGLNYICCNFVNVGDGSLVLPKGYEVLPYTVDGKTVNIGYVGIGTPESIQKGTPKYFQDESGEFIYSFKEKPEDLYQTVQDNINACVTDGADFVVLLSHLGDTGVEDGWSSRDLIANTKGAGVVLDGHAHSVIPSETLKNKDGEDVLLTASGTKLNNLGVLKLSVTESGIVPSTLLINTVTDEEKASEAYKTMDDSVKKVEADYAYLETVHGTTPFALRIYNSETGERTVRKQDTNMGDFLTDGYLWYANNDPNVEGFQKADVAFLNGGSIRADIAEGDIQFGHLLAVMPWATRVTEIKTTGQHILEALEMGARNLPDKESGGFIVASGLTYKIDPTVESKVVTDDKGMFVKVDGTFENGDFRVYDVMIGDKPIDPEATYTLVINAYYSENMGDGMTMFKDDEFIVTSEADVVDVDVITAYLEDGLGGTVPDKYADENGDGRILVQAQGLPQTGETPNSSRTAVIVLLLGTATLLLALARRKKNAANR